MLIQRIVAQYMYFEVLAPEHRTAVRARGVQNAVRRQPQLVAIVALAVPAAADNNDNWQRILFCAHQNICSQLK